MSGKPFYLGLTMAGAISAGAYSAGVFDFLIEALEEWERAKKEDLEREPGDRRVPNHKVVIPVVSGASAGGITAALGLLSAANPLAIPTPAQAASVKAVVPALYQAWVESISFVPRKNTAGSTARSSGYLLDVSDLKDGPLCSLLDASVIHNAADALITETRHVSHPRPYFARDLHLFLAITNLRGVPYRIDFTGSDGHVMTLHGDRMHYRLHGLGTQRFKSNWLKQYGDQGVEVTARELGRTEFRHTFLEAALGTGAFPIGLPARLIDRHTKDFAARAWPYRWQREVGNITPDWPPRADGTKDYSAIYAGSDGGIIDNEPFEVARWALMKRPGFRNDPSAEKSDRAVLMIDPFPSPSAFDPDLTEDEVRGQVWLRAVIASLIPALKNQARVKAIDLARAGNVAVHSRFLISPSRQKLGTQQDVADPLASGVLGAFGGFLARKFSEHDYQLGRRNCQWFFTQHLVLAADNDVVKHWPEKAAADFEFERDGMRYRRVIPLCGSAKVEVEPLLWPRIDDDVVDEFLRHVKTRGSAVAKKFAREELSTWVFKAAVRVGWRFYRSRLLENIRLLLVADLIRRDQHEKWAKLETDLDRQIIAELFEPAFDARSATGIARSINRRARDRKGSSAVYAIDVTTRLRGSLAGYVIPLDYSGDDVFRLRNRWRKPPLFAELTVDRRLSPRP